MTGASPVRDEERIRIVRQELEGGGLSAVVCRLPANVLMLTGYLPVLGRSFALFPRAGSPALLVPTEDDPLARSGWVRNVRSFDVPPAGDLVESAEPGLAQLARRLALDGKRIGFEGSGELLPPCYTQSSAVGFQTVEMYRRALAAGELIDATAALRRAAAVKTQPEVERIRWVCQIAAFAFHRAREVIRPGATEGEVAGAMADAVFHRAFGFRGVRRVFPYPRVLSGTRSADACRLDVDTGGRELRRGDAVVVILALSADGYAAQIVRTFFVGPATPRQRMAYEACLQAQRAALAGIRDGVAAAEVAALAARALAERGSGEVPCSQFGHGVGFQAIAPDWPPRLAAWSTDVLAAGMTHTLDLGVVLPEATGIRLADVVLVQPLGAEVLSRVEDSLEWVSG